jgi:glycosyltransferase involved in cell wall biosynthesis
MLGEASNIVVGWRPSSVSGWGVYAQNLLCQIVEKGRNPILYLSPHLMDVTPDKAKLLKPVLQKQVHLEELLDKVGLLEFDCPVLHALRNDFKPSLAEQSARGNKNIGITFFESTKISKEGFVRANEYDLIVTGSSWNKDILESRGLDNVANIFQGIDQKLFKPRKKDLKYQDRFVIYSGGKLEYRKAQDVVAVSFREFQKKHNEALLIFAWANQWAKIMPTISQSKFTRGQPDVTDGNLMLIDEWLIKNGLLKDTFINLGMPPNKALPAYISAADMAIFPNRCEPGTNLMAMEAMAMGIPSIIAANTGQLDLIAENRCYPLIDQTPVQPYPPYNEVKGWREPTIEETLERMEEIYQDRTGARRRGVKATNFISKFSWSNQIDHLLSEIDALYGE